MKRLFLLLVCALELLLFAGRGGLRGRYREVEQLLVIQTMGLDDYRGGVTLTLAAMGDADRGVTRLRAGGASISAAMDRIRSYSWEDELFCPHIGQLLLGEKAAEQGVERYLAYVCRSPELRLDLPLYIVREDTAERAVMDVGSDTKGICDVMKTIEQSAKRRGDCALTTAAEVLRDTQRCGSALVCALDLGAASGGEDGADGETALSAAPLGYAILREGRLCRYLTREQAIAVGLLKNASGAAAVQLQDRHGNNAVLQLLGGSSRIRPVWEGGTLKGLRVSVEARAEVLELGGRGALKGTEDADDLTARLEARLSQYLSATLQASKELKADFLGLAEIAERDNPAAFRAMGRDFVDLLPELELEISVSARLSQTEDQR